MTDRPDARELLEIARTAMANELLPFLPPDKRLTGLMVSSALSMAAREMDTSIPAVPAVTVADIRSGRHDTDTSLHEALLAEAKQRALISNPKDVDG